MKECETIWDYYCTNISFDQNPSTFLSSVVYIVIHGCIYFSCFKTLLVLRDNPVKLRRYQSWEEAKS